MNRIRKAWAAFFVSRLVGLGIDTLALGAAYVGAFLLRFDFQAPRWGWRTVAASFVTVWFVHVAALVACGCYRRPWRRTGLADLTRYVAAAGTACLVMSALRFITPVESYMHLRPPYSITLIMFFLAAIGVIVWRILWTWTVLARLDDEMLLSRKPRRMDNAPVLEFLRGKTVMITGAGGSIGSELVRQVARAAPKRVLMVERGENALYEIDREMRHQEVKSTLLPLMVDINDADRMDALFRAHRPEIVLHAAAYKHVPMVELNPDEGWRNNTEATRRLAELSARHGVARFVMISTDKAVRPVSVMGQTKRAAEKAIMALNAETSGTSFCAVRFGNVLGSSGSVVPLFNEQIRKGQPVTVTHPDMKRYFMTIPEAVGLVLQAASRAERAIYTLDMGAPVRIVDLAERIIRRAGYKPYVDVPIRFTGIRPGEKLFEELDISVRSAYKTDMARIYITRETETQGADCERSAADFSKGT